MAADTKNNEYHTISSLSSTYIYGCFRLVLSLALKGSYPGTSLRRLTVLNAFLIERISQSGPDSTTITTTTTRETNKPTNYQVTKLV